MTAGDSSNLIHVLVAGEALIDLMPIAGEGDAFRAVPGGSPFNVAVGLARLDVPTGFLGCLSTDPFGRRLRRALVAERVSTRFVRDSDRPTTLALVAPSARGEPKFTFYGGDAADLQLRAADLPAGLPDEVAAIHVGSYAIARPPIADTLFDWAAQQMGRRVVTIDPNLRPSLIPDPEAFRRRLPQWLERSDVVKLSRADLAWIEPSLPEAEWVARTLARGPRLVVLTRGADGASGHTVDGSVHVPAPVVDAADAVGAGDSFMSGLLAWLYHHDRLSKDRIAQLPLDEMREALTFASRAAAYTCTRFGADPPTRREIDGA